MGFVDVGARRFSAELSTFLDKRVVVRTAKRTYTGTLLGYSTSNYSVVLSDAEDDQGNYYPRVVIYGHAISEILLTEEPLDMEELAKRLEQVFPRMVKYYPEAKLITVMERVRVTEKGVEGTGPIAERVRTIYQKFVEEWRERRKGQSR